MSRIQLYVKPGHGFSPVAIANLKTQLEELGRKCDDGETELSVDVVGDCILVGGNCTDPLFDTVDKLTSQLSPTRH